jgi:hypothetical protein
MKVSIPRSWKIRAQRTEDDILSNAGEPSMTTLFDVLTVSAFVGLVIAFFKFSDRETPTLMHFVFVGAVFAVANQVGNAGATILASILILAGAGYAAMIVRR